MGQPLFRTLGTARDWVEMLHAVARPALPPEVLDGGLDPSEAQAFIAGFADSTGNRRRVDRPLLAHLMGVAINGGAASAMDPEERAWWLLHRPEDAEDMPVDWNGSGPLFPSLRERGVEWWTQAELCGAHALAWHGLNARSGAVLLRVGRAAEWLLEEVQPDNATQWPWGVHIFASMAVDPSRDGSVRSSALQYAQTLVHNAIVNTGTPDRFAACILWSSAEWLDRARQSDWLDAPPLIASVTAR